ncbi:predicted protein [Uncinocarpus reesii 1704]|uniref:Myb-like DNA-binding domain-containing protein n=1 Tax=Uncinocarpus reesii (strain UAMH 1704) TaxID=336963 RepID=C4JDF9_UNCRE|nr:uncharacterized protein UREG_00385 [Uncinocarpus reesii 1704]EEP75539.1 predicted protein [Uncinocarpus reesii 1704]
MPSKLQLDVNLWFLYLCLQKSDYKTIDFHAVGEAANINPPAARMRFTRLKKTIENGALNSPAGTLFPGGTEGTARLSSSSSRGKGKAQSSAAKSVKTLEKGKLSSKAKSNIPTSRVGYLHPKIAEPVVKVEIDDDLSCYSMGVGNNMNGIGEGDDEEDIPLAIRRRSMLARKRHAESNFRFQDDKRRKVGSGDENSALAIHTGFPISTGFGGTFNSDMEIVGVGPAGHSDGLDWVVPHYVPQPQNGYQISSDAANQPVLPQFNTASTDLPLRAWQDVINPFNSSQAPTENFQGNNWAQAIVPSQAAPSHISTSSHVEISPSDTISLSSTSSIDSPVIKPTVPKIAPLPQIDTFCTRYPGFQPAADDKWSWRQYQLPHIVITDMDPHSPRNRLSPHSSIAIGKTEKSVNNALFGSASAAFGRMPTMGGAQSHSNKENDVKRYLEVPWVPAEENPKGQNKTEFSKEPIVIE